MQIDPCPSEDDYESGPSLRASEWQNFATRVFNHIESYTVPQYGDKGHDQ